MVAGRLGKYTRTMNYASALRIFSSKAELLETRQCDGSGTHGARLQRYPQGAVVEPRRPKLYCRRSNRFHFRMRSGIERTPHRITRLGNNFVAESDDRPDRDLAHCGRISG